MRCNRPVHHEGCVFGHGHGRARARLRIRKIRGQTLVKRMGLCKIRWMKIAFLCGASLVGLGVLQGCSGQERVQAQGDASTDAEAADASSAVPLAKDSALDVAADIPSSKLINQMTFFVTSVGTGSAGGNLGGLAGADANCLAIAASVGARPRTWRAYLSASTIDARDRIGTGPWVNVLGQTVATSVADLHTLGGARGPAIALLADEHGATRRTEHDILTGSNEQGRKTTATCSEWTSSSDTAQGRVGHVDWSEFANGTWNSVHTSPCSESGLASNNGAGRTYCFAID